MTAKQARRRAKYICPMGIEQNVMDACPRCGATENTEEGCLAVDKVNAAIEKRALKHTPAWPFATKSKLTAAKKKPAVKKSKSKPTTKGKKK